MSFRRRARAPSLQPLRLDRNAASANDITFAATTSPRSPAHHQLIRQSAIGRRSSPHRRAESQQTLRRRVLSERSVGPPISSSMDSPSGLVIEINLAPPSPPPADHEYEQGLSFGSLQNRNFLTIPVETEGLTEPRGSTASPPPDSRRSSYASTMSNDSVASSLLSATLPTSPSYQNLLSPSSNMPPFPINFFGEDTAVNSDSSNQVSLAWGCF